jgi:hypothetical protein
MIKSKQLSGHGTVSTHNVGEAAGEIVVLDSQGRLPAIDGSNITGVSGSSGGSTTLRNLVEVSFSSNYQIPDTHPIGSLIALSNTSGGTLEAYLPSSQSSNIGQGYYFFVGNYRTTSRTISLKPHPSTSDTISTFQTQFTLAQNDCLKLISDGAGNWIMLQTGQR